MAEIKYVTEPNSWLVTSPGRGPDSSGSRQLLLGQRLHIDETTSDDDWVAAATVPNANGSTQTGFVERSKLSDHQQLKIFYTDVGQGDATLIEADGAIIIIDGGPNRGFSDLLSDRLEALQRADQAVGLPARQFLHINAIIISHFDKDHYFGLTRILNDTRYTFGTIYHNGLPRYGVGPDKDLDLGTLSNSHFGGKAISTDLRGFDSAQAMLDNDELLTARGNLNQFGQFLDAVLQARDANRLDGFELLVKREPQGTMLILPDTGPDIEIEVLAPVTTRENGPIRLQAFPDPHRITESNPNPSPSESHTINGNSVVLRMVYGQNSFLFGGDLNEPSQRYIHMRYGDFANFTSDVNKACHHGSSDFDLEFVKAVSPHVTVFSSGDNGTYDHPMPDAMGTAARHSQGDYPLVFSTELARETGSKGIHFGHINARSNGEVVVMAQKKESGGTKSQWHAFPIPYFGPFHSGHMS